MKQRNDGATAVAFGTIYAYSSSLATTQDEQRKENRSILELELATKGHQ